MLRPVIKARARIAIRLPRPVVARIGGDKMRAKMNVRDHCTEARAYQLARRLEAYWAERGWRVKAYTVKMPFHKTMRMVPYAVRSDMIGGWPRAKL